MDEFGMMGAALLYVLINMVLVLIYGVVIVSGIRHRNNCCADIKVDEYGD